MRHMNLGVLQEIFVAGLLAVLCVAVALGFLLDHGVLVGPGLPVLQDGLDGATGVPLGGVAGEGLRLVGDLGGAAQDYDEPGHEHN